MKEKEKDIFDKIMALPGLNIFEGFYQKYKEMLLYLFFGGMTAVISIGSYSYCDVGLGFDPLIANIISWLLSVLWSFYWNNKFVFKKEDGEKRNIWAALFKTYVSYGFTGLILNNILLVLWISVLHMNKMIAPIINLIINIPINFFLNKIWAFGKK